jgi:hypothetical protein
MKDDAVPLYELAYLLAINNIGAYTLSKVEIGLD